MLKPKNLFQANITEDKTALFFMTNSEKEFWMKQEPTDWEKVKIDSREVFRDGGSTIYSFNGKEYKELYIPSPFKRNETSYISGDFQSVKLEKILVSKEKLEEIGIIYQIELDLTNVPETIVEVERAQREREEVREKKKYIFGRTDYSSDSKDKGIHGFNFRKKIRKKTKNLFEPENSENIEQAPRLMGSSVFFDNLQASATVSGVTTFAEEDTLAKTVAKLAM
ncbi:hypothetical protein A1D18_03235 [Candidatus Rickettsiella isopodorum]|jgi:hypothetical protein|uniref:Uncharacterized protein n=1 Tax=Candidatus Rickettsiella isopodorum TaxID=1225476 RepID=A0A1J8PJ29_9COXI|nr:hypothetical protein [Candidatus Rickettsiella isopodorum]OIZ95125.1 hypothetical protein A1D18_03235 [Candidatus Rickettsiella isopodorum]